MWTCEKCGEKHEDEFDSCWKCAGEPEKIGLPFTVLMKNSDRQVVRGLLLSLGLIPVTWLCFGPIAGFHHMIGFGVTFYLVLDGETQQAGDLIWQNYAVRFNPELLVISILLWLLAVFMVFKLVRFLSKLSLVP